MSSGLVSVSMPSGHSSASGHGDDVTMTSSAGRSSSSDDVIASRASSMPDMTSSAGDDEVTRTSSASSTSAQLDSCDCRERSAACPVYNMQYLIPHWFTQSSQRNNKKEIRQLANTSLGPCAYSYGYCMLRPAPKAIWRFYVPANYQRFSPSDEVPSVSERTMTTDCLSIRIHHYLAC